MGALYFLGRSAGDLVPRFAQWVGSLRTLGPVMFVAGYAVGVVAFVPGAVLTLAAGAIFDLVEGVV